MSGRSFFETFDHTFADLLGHRASTFRAALAALPPGPGDLLIVETGCLRDPGNWAGDGQSSYLFDRFLRWRGGRLIAFEIDQACAAATRSVTGPLAEVIVGDSVGGLAGYGLEPASIDLLYLDSLDFDGNNPLVSATHHLYELCAARPALKDGAVVLVDDTSWPDRGQPFGKGMLIAPFMERVGARLLAKGETQVAWMV